VELTFIGLVIAVMFFVVIGGFIFVLSVIGSFLFTLFEWLEDLVSSAWRKRRFRKFEPVAFEPQGVIRTDQVAHVIRTDQVDHVELAPTYSEPVGTKQAPKRVAAPIATDIGSRASGTYAMWSLLVKSDFLGGKWSETDWARCVVGVKGGVPSRIELPMNTREHYQTMLAKYRFGVSMTVLMSELTSAYENKMYHHVHDVASLCFGDKMFSDHDNFFEWFVRASSTKELRPASEVKHLALSRSVARTKAMLLEETNFALVHRIYVSATRLTFTE
jgi:hypothetical protein